MATNFFRQSTRYSDFKVNLDPHPVKQDLARLTNDDSIKRSLINLMLTNPYERPFNPDIGAGLRSYLFENVDDTTVQTIREKIIETAERYEPRAEILDVDIDLEAARHNLNITITFVAINTSEPQTLSVILTRIR